MFPLRSTFCEGKGGLVCFGVYLEELINGMLSSVSKTLIDIMRLRLLTKYNLP
jgi:hypothetical protein